MILPRSAGAGWRVDEPKTPFLTRLAADHLLVVMGYSGSDDFDITPALESSAVRGLVWIDHLPGPIRETRVTDSRSLEDLFGGKPPNLLQLLRAHRSPR